MDEKHYSKTVNPASIPTLSEMEEHRSHTSTAAVVDGKSIKAELSEKGKHVNVYWSNGHCSSFSAEWIRQHDCSPLSYNLNFNQRLVNRALIPADPTLTEIHIDEKKNILHFTSTENENNFSGYVTGQLLAEVDWLRRQTAKPRPQQLNFATEIKAIQLSATETQLENFQKFVCNALTSDGVCVVRTGRTDAGYVADFVHDALGMRVWQSVYGRTFQIRAEPRPDNIAYTTAALDWHLDLPYYESPPGLQLLHCRENSVTGGNLLLIDGVKVAESMKIEFPEEFRTLVRVPVLYQQLINKENVEGQYSAFIRRLQPMIAVNWHDEVVDVRFNAITEGPMIMPEEDEKAFLQAYRIFYSMLMREEWQLRWNYAPGDIVVFNNRQMLHARMKFEESGAGGGGKRHLEGCYVNMDEFRSKAICLEKNYRNKIGEENLCFEPRVCNGSWM